MHYFGNLDSVYSSFPALAFPRLCVIFIALHLEIHNAYTSKVFLLSYARVLCHFAALVHLFTDACKEGDGECVIRCWKLCMLLPCREEY